MILDSIVPLLLSFIKTHGALAVFLGVLAEEIIIPIPSFAILMGAGFFIVPPGAPLASALQTMLISIVLPASIAATIGAFFPYAIGYYGGERVIQRVERFIDFTWSDVQHAGRRLEKEGNVWLLLIVSRAMVVVPMSLVSVAAGALRLPWRQFALTTFIGSVPRAFILAFLGWRFGGAYATLIGSFGLAEQVVVIVLLSAAAYVFYRHVKHHVTR